MKISKKDLVTIVASLNESGHKELANKFIDAHNLLLFEYHLELIQQNLRSY